MKYREEVVRGVRENPWEHSVIETGKKIGFNKAENDQI